MHTILISMLLGSYYRRRLWKEFVVRRAAGIVKIMIKEKEIWFFKNRTRPNWSHRVVWSRCRRNDPLRVPSSPRRFGSLSLTFYIIAIDKDGHSYRMPDTKQLRLVKVLLIHRSVYGLKKSLLGWSKISSVPFTSRSFGRVTIKKDSPYDFAFVVVVDRWICVLFIVGINLAPCVRSESFERGTFRTSHAAGVVSSFAPSTVVFISKGIPCFNISLPFQHSFSNRDTVFFPRFIKPVAAQVAFLSVYIFFSFFQIYFGWPSVVDASSRLTKIMYIPVCHVRVYIFDGECSNSQKNPNPAKQSRRCFAPAMYICHKYRPPVVFLAGQSFIIISVEFGELVVHLSADRYQYGCVGKPIFSIVSSITACRKTKLWPSRTRLLRW